MSARRVVREKQEGETPEVVNTDIHQTEEESPWANSIRGKVAGDQPGEGQ